MADTGDTQGAADQTVSVPLPKLMELIARMYGGEGLALGARQ